MSLVGSAIQIIMLALFAAVVVVVAEALAGLRNPPLSHPLLSNGGDSGLPLLRRGGFSDGLVLVIALLGIRFGLAWLFHWLEAILNLPVHVFAFNLPVELDMYLPWLGILNGALITGLFAGVLALILFVILETGIRSNWLRALILLLISVTTTKLLEGVTGNPTGAEFIWSAFKSAVFVVVAYLVLKYWIRARLWVLIIAMILTSLIKSGINLLNWGESPYNTQGWLLLCLAALAPVWLVVKSIRTRDVQQS
jgi:hypothetical protein